MITDYITEYIGARKSGDRKTMARIEKDLAKLGVDMITLAAFITALGNEEGANG
jgi:hypothetical protein